MWRKDACGPSLLIIKLNLIVVFLINKVDLAVSCSPSASCMIHFNIQLSFTQEILALGFHIKAIFHHYPGM